MSPLASSVSDMTSAHETVAAYWAAAEARDWDGFGALLAGDVLYRGPQAREQVRGRDAYVRFNVEGFPNWWHIVVQITDFWPEQSELPASRAHLVDRY